MGGLLIDHLMCLVLVMHSTVVELLVMLFYLFFFQKVKKNNINLLVGDHVILQWTGCFFKTQAVGRKSRKSKKSRDLMKGVRGFGELLQLTISLDHFVSPGLILWSKVHRLSYGLLLYISTSRIFFRTCSGIERLTNNDSLFVSQALCKSQRSL